MFSAEGKGNVSIDSYYSRPTLQLFKEAPWICYQHSPHLSGRQAWILCSFLLHQDSHLVCSGMVKGCWLLPGSVSKSLLRLESELLCFWNRVSYDSSHWPVLPCVAQASLEVQILLPQALKCLDYRCVARCLAPKNPICEGGCFGNRTWVWRNVSDHDKRNLVWRGALELPGHLYVMGMHHVCAQGALCAHLLRIVWMRCHVDTWQQWLTAFTSAIWRVFWFPFH